MNKNAAYPEFEHEAKELARYIEAAGIFSILLRDGTVVHFRPNNKEEFRLWLSLHEISNVRDS